MYHQLRDTSQEKSQKKLTSSATSEDLLDASFAGQKEAPPERLNPKELIRQEVPGKITQLIGSGKYAQSAIVWWTIKWSFIVGGMLTAGAFISHWVYKDEGTLAENIKNIWSIFAPIITLALGYIFGKGQK